MEKIDKVYCIRVTVGRTGFTDEECLARLSKVLSKFCDSWCVVEEMEGEDNRHWQGWVTSTTQKTPNNLRNNISNAFKGASVSGNSLVSVTSMRTTFDSLQCYTMKGRTKGDAVKIITVQYIEYNEDYVKKWHVDENWYNKTQRKPKDEGHVIDAAVEYFKSNPPCRSDPERHVGAWMLDWIRERKSYPGDYIFSNYITTVLHRIDPKWSETILDRVIFKLNKH